VFKIGGPDNTVEADETFVGAKAVSMHESRKLKLRQIRGENQLGDLYIGKMYGTQTSFHCCGDATRAPTQCQNGWGGLISAP
jgi:hypothetical protein